MSSEFSESAGNATDPADELLRLLSRAQRLEDLPRSGWLPAGVDDPESVASHSWEVVVVTLWLADRSERDVDVERAVRIAVVHDIAEALVTDLPRPVKELVGVDAVAEAEAEAADQLLGALPEDWRQAHEAYQRRSSIEAKLVKAADRLQMYAKALQYDSQHRGDVERFWDGGGPAMPDELPLARRIARRLVERHESGEWFPNDFS
ncbi:MAG: HD family hydrolase [Bradymonadaceae bacterium]